MIKVLLTLVESPTEVTLIAAELFEIAAYSEVKPVKLEED